MAAWLALGLAATSATPLARGADEDARLAATLRQFCFECHDNDEPEARIDLQEMTSDRDLGRRFKEWEKVVAALRSRKMPPKGEAQPEDGAREEAARAIERGLDQFARAHAGDPGKVVLRRLTSAEHGYTIQDLTGLEMKGLETLGSDAASGEGFTNAGTGQFMQDSTLERYLEAAKSVADRAVIGAGPLVFFNDPGQTGLELSAITRIQKIYREHGFRTAAGEGAEPFGLDLYPRAFLVAWRYRHREPLGLGKATLPELAHRERMSARLCEHVWNVLQRDGLPFPLSEIVSQWRALPVPTEQKRSESEQAARDRCDELAGTLREWQGTLAAGAGDEEEAAVLTEGEVKVAPSHALTADINWPRGARVASLELSVLPASKYPIEGAVVVWRNPRLRISLEDGKRLFPRPLKSFVSAESAEKLAFGKAPEGVRLGDGDFVIRGGATIAVTLRAPEDAMSAQLMVDVALQTKQGPSSIVRCRISDGEVPGETVAEVGATSTLLADPSNSLVEEWQKDVAEFARLLPEVSQREPAPSDRDPIPEPFDNAYNKPERNHFHSVIKYHRDDAFFVAHVADDATRRALDQAWADLLTSFEYHDANLRFLDEKFALGLEQPSVASLDATRLERMPEKPRAFARRLVEEYAAMRRARQAAEPGHVEDAIAFAELAWRRPLSGDDRQRLRRFYHERRQGDGLDHTRAIRALLTRILVAPAFLYRVEPPASGEAIVPLSDWQLANRLSYFLWSSAPDDELRREASAGRLRDPEQLGQQARRMLRDPKARRLATEFFGQWLGFYRFDLHQGIDTERFPEFNDELRAALHEEAVAFLEHIVREDRPVDEILFADYSFWNQRLAEHYGAAGMKLAGEGFAKVEGLGARHRGGLLGLGAVLTVTSAPLRTSAVKRGDWVLRRVVGTPVPPPPADAGSIPADDVLADELTVRQRLEAHRSKPSCVDCHARIDPLGLALEHFDPIGRWRDRYRDGQPIDPTGTLTDGTRIDGFDSLRDYLRREKASFHRTLAAKLLGYALGRAELVTDRPLLDGMTRAMNDGDHFADMVVRVVTSKSFRYQRAGNGS